MTSGEPTISIAAHPTHYTLIPWAIRVTSGEPTISIAAHPTHYILITLSYQRDIRWTNHLYCSSPYTLYPHYPEPPAWHQVNQPSLLQLTLHTISLLPWAIIVTSGEPTISIAAHPTHYILITLSHQHDIRWTNCLYCSSPYTLYPYYPEPPAWHQVNQPSLLQLTLHTISLLPWATSMTSGEPTISIAAHPTHYILITLSHQRDIRWTNCLYCSSPYTLYPYYPEPSAWHQVNQLPLLQLTLHTISLLPWAISVTSGEPTISIAAHPTHYILIPWATSVTLGEPTISIAAHPTHYILITLSHQRDIRWTNHLYCSSPYTLYPYTLSHQRDLRWTNCLYCSSPYTLYPYYPEPSAWHQVNQPSLLQLTLHTISLLPWAISVTSGEPTVSIAAYPTHYILIPWATSVTLGRDGSRGRTQRPPKGPNSFVLTYKAFKTFKTPLSVWRPLPR